jgi:hypothetical protein
MGSPSTTARGSEAAEVVEELVARAVDGLDGRRALVILGIGGREHGVREREHPLPVRARDAEHLGDHRERHDCGE